MNYAIILAGGVGSRFWPLSTEDEPKQFLRLFSDKTLLEETILRVSTLISSKNIFIAAGQDHKAKIRQCAGNIPEGNLFFEPLGRNTLAPIAVLTQLIFNRDKDAVIAVFPCDHMIDGRSKFKKAMRKSIEAAEKGCIVTIGIIPKRPETGYGYIKTSSELITHSSSAHKVERFIEKPNLAKAKKLIKDKRYYWNAGIFVFKARAFLEEIKRQNAGMYRVLRGIRNRADASRKWPEFPVVSIDYGIMEKARRVALVPADFKWSDLGSWKSTEEIMKKNKSGNISRGRHIDLGSKNTTVWSEAKTVATLGLRDLIIVDTKAGLLVCSKNSTQGIKKLFPQLRNKA